MRGDQFSAGLWTSAANVCMISGFPNPAVCSQRGGSMAVTLTDVAKAAGVSASTVSRTLSRPERVDADTRDKIFREIARLGYQPNLAARSLITGRTGNLGVVVPDLANPFFPDLVRAVQLQAHQRGFTVLLVCLLYTSPSPRDGL